MYLRISHGHFDPARYGEMSSLVQQVAGVVQGLPGNQSVYVGIDRTGGKTYTVSTWDTVEHANFPRETAPRLSEVVGKLVSLGLQLDPPVVVEIVN
jgi:hypothetical protein